MQNPITSLKEILESKIHSAKENNVVHAVPKRVLPEFVYNRGDPNIKRKKNSTASPHPASNAWSGYLSQHKLTEPNKRPVTETPVRMEYLIRFAQQHESFRLPEIQALATLARIDLEIISYNEHVRVISLHTYFLSFTWIQTMISHLRSITTWLYISWS